MGHIDINTVSHHLPDGRSLLHEVSLRVVMRGREMNGWIEVDSEGTGNDEDLQVWVDRGVAYAASLPPKR